MPAPPSISRARRRLVMLTCAGLAAAAGVTAVAAVETATPAEAASPCPSSPVPIFHVVRPSDGVSLYTSNQTEAQAAANYGFTDNRGIAFHGAASAGGSMIGLRRLWHPRTGDFFWAPQAEAADAVARYGYVDQGLNFAVSNVDDACLVPVRRYVRNGLHRFAVTATDQQALVAGGWADEGVHFYAAPSTGTAPAPAPVPPPPTTPATSAGALPLGSANYAVPTGAIHVSPQGNDASAGSAAAPVRTVTRALALAPSGGTVVLAGGSYRESVTVSKPVTIQNAPGAVVWFEGSAPVSGWIRTATGWRKDGWTTRFDHSPTYTKGAPDNAPPLWNFVNASHPMAAHPDQLWINGVAQTQVRTLAELRAGTFYLDEATSQLHIGSDPTGRTVEASTLSKALSVRAAGTVLRGIGFRRYAPSVWMVAGVTLEAPSARVENVVVQSMATTGISAMGADTTFDRVSVLDSGMMGIHGRFADRLRLTSVLVTRNNAERFNITPSAGGVKLGQTRGVTVRDSSFSGNYGHGFWIDMSVYNTTYVNNTFRDNVATGLFLEISARAVVVDNLFSGNGEFGIKVNNTSDVKIWNNTFVFNGRPLNIVQDSRRNTNQWDAAVDPRIAWPDPAMPWTLGPVTIANNVIGSARPSANCLLCVEDYSRQHSAEQMGITANSNMYQRPSTSQPTWLVVWSKGWDPSVHTSLQAFTAATGQERSGREFVGAAIVDANGAVTSAVSSLAPSLASPLPADVAAIAGRASGTRQLGFWP